MVRYKVKQLIFRIKYKRSVHMGNDVRFNNSDYFEGNNVISDRCSIKYSSIGYATYVGHDSNISWASIGKYCSIAPQFNTVIGSHPIKFVSMHPSFYSVNNASKLSYVKRTLYNDLKWINEKTLISIGNDVWIGQDVKVCDGVTIGDGAVVAAGSFVKADVLPYTIVGGIPAKVISNRFDSSDIEFFNDLQWWNLPFYVLEQLSPYFTSVERLQKYIKELSSELSVVVPYYNKKKYIKECIDSIEKQIVCPYEIIIVDDCSNDNPDDIFSELKCSYDNIRIIRLAKNSGVSHARNVGIENACRKYITFIDADDFYYDKRKLLCELLLVKKGESENRKIVAYSKTVQVDKNGCFLKKYDNYKDYLQGNAFLKILSTWKSETIPRDYIINKNTLEEIATYNERRSLYEDLELLLHLSKECELCFTGIEGTAYRQFTNGLSSVDGNRHKIALNEIWNSFFKELSFGDKIKFVLLKCCSKIRRKYLRVRK